MLKNQLPTTLPVPPTALNYHFKSSLLQRVPCEKWRVLLREQAWGFMIPQIVQAFGLRSTLKKLGFLLQNQEMATLLLPFFIYCLQELGSNPFYFLWHFPLLDGKPGKNFFVSSFDSFSYACIRQLFLSQFFILDHTNGFGKNSLEKETASLSLS